MIKDVILIVLSVPFLQAKCVSLETIVQLTPFRNLPDFIRRILRVFHCISLYFFPFSLVISINNDLNCLLQAPLIFGQHLFCNFFPVIFFFL